MRIITEWHLWLLPILGVFEFILLQQKRRYAMEHSRIDSPIDYSVSDDYRVTLIFAILLFLPFVIIAMNRPLDIGDSGSYKGMFEKWPNSLGDVQIIDKDKYPGFKYFTVFFKQFISKDYRVWFFVIAAISIFSMASMYKKYTSEIVLCAYLFFTADFQGWVNNGCRQFMVAAIMFALTPILFKKKISRFIIFALVGWLLFYFHVSVMVALPLFFISLGKPLNKRTILFIFLIVIAIVFVNQFSGLITDTLENTAYEKSSAEISSTESGTNIFRVLFFSIPTVLAIIFRKKVDDNTPQIIAYSINMSLIGTSFYILSAFMNGLTIGRMPIYFTLFNYILLPWEIRHFFRKENHIIIFITIILVFFTFYSYQMYKWGIGLNQ